MINYIELILNLSYFNNIELIFREILMNSIIAKDRLSKAIENLELVIENKISKLEYENLKLKQELARFKKDEILSDVKSNLKIHSKDPANANITDISVNQNETSSENGKTKMSDVESSLLKLKKLVS